MSDSVTSFSSTVLQLLIDLRHRLQQRFLALHGLLLVFDLPAHPFELVRHVGDVADVVAHFHLQLGPRPAGRPPCRARSGGMHDVQRLGVSVWPSTVIFTRVIARSRDTDRLRACDAPVRHGTRFLSLEARLLPDVRILRPAWCAAPRGAAPRSAYPMRRDSIRRAPVTRRHLAPPARPWNRGSRFRRAPWEQPSART